MGGSRPTTWRAGGRGVFSRARDGAAWPPRGRVAGSRGAARPRGRHRRRARGDRSVGDGDGARRVHGRAAVAEGQMMTTERSPICRLLTACAAAAALAVALPAYAQVPVPLGGAPAQPPRGPRHATRSRHPPPRRRLRLVPTGVAPRAGQVVEAPIRCWWKTDRTAVRVGERFAVVLTCASIETGPTTVVPNVSQMEGGAIQLAPFEVVGSTRRADVVVTPWRYVQFEYVGAAAERRVLRAGRERPAADGHLQLQRPATARTPAVTRPTSSPHSRCACCRSCRVRWPTFATPRP